MTDEVLLRRFLATGLPTSRASPWATPDAATAVGWLGAVQAQEFEMTLWSLARRCGQPRAALLAAFQEGRLVRAHALRQTWHLLRAEDFAWIQAATAPRVQAANARLYRELDLGHALLRRTADLVSAAVAEHPMTRAEIAHRLAQNGIEASGLRLVFILMNAELEGLVVSGPLRGRQHTYAPAPRHAGPAGDEALVELARRFLQSHGPASVGDLAAWASLPRRAARAAIEALGDLVRRESHGGFELFALDHDSPRLPDWDTPQVDLLNGYDEYLSGASEAKRLIAPDWVFRQRPGAPIAVVTIDGMLAGNWRRRLTTKLVEIEVTPLRRFTAAELMALERQAAALGAFHGVDHRVSVTPVST